MRAKALLVLLLAGVSVPAGALEPVTFDGFFKGIESCRTTPAFDSYYKSLGAKFGNLSGSKRAVVNAAVKLVVPGEIQRGLGGGTSTSNGDHTVVRIEAAGTYQGLPVKGLEFVLGNENGIAIHSVLFSAPRAEVIKKFGTVVARANKAAKTASEEEGGFTVGFGKGSDSRLYCDRSM